MLSIVFAALVTGVIFILNSVWNLGIPMSFGVAFFLLVAFAVGTFDYLLSLIGQVKEIHNKAELVLLIGLSVIIVIWRLVYIFGAVRVLFGDYIVGVVLVAVGIVLDHFILWASFTEGEERVWWHPVHYHP